MQLTVNRAGRDGEKTTEPRRNALWLPLLMSENRFLIQTKRNVPRVNYRIGAFAQAGLSPSEQPIL